MPAQIEAALHVLQLFKDRLRAFDEEVRTFGVFPSLFLSLVSPDGEWDNYGGVLRLVDAQGQMLEPAIDPQR